MTLRPRNLEIGFNLQVEAPHTSISLHTEGLHGVRIPVPGSIASGNAEIFTFGRLCGIVIVVTHHHKLVLAKKIIFGLEPNIHGEAKPWKSRNHLRRSPFGLPHRSANRRQTEPEL